MTLKREYRLQVAGCECSLADMVTCVFSLPGHGAVLAGEGTGGAVRADRRHGHDDLGALFDGLGAPVALRSVAV
jgi:hypothetical protein